MLTQKQIPLGWMHSSTPNPRGGCPGIRGNCSLLRRVMVPEGHAAMGPASCRKPDRPKSTCWSSREILGMKREALLDCYRSMQKEIYGNLWARTSVDLAVKVRM